MLTRPFQRLLASALLALPLLVLPGCQIDSSNLPSADDAINKAQQATDRAQQWVDANREVARRVDRMWRAYDQGNLDQASNELAALRQSVNWDEGILAHDELRTRILEGGTGIYEALDQPDKAQALLQEVLPHLDGETGRRWEAALQAYQDAGTQQPAE